MRKATNSLEVCARSPRAVRCSTPKIVEAIVSPVTRDGGLTADQDRLLKLVAEGKPIKAIAAMEQTTPASIAEAVEQLFMTLSEEARTDRTRRGVGPGLDSGLAPNPPQREFGRQRAADPGGSRDQLKGTPRSDRRAAGPR